MIDELKSEHFPLKSDRNVMEAWLNRRATANPAFRQALLTDTRAALEHVVGKKMPEHVQVEVVEESLSELVLVRRFAGEYTKVPPGLKHDKDMLFLLALNHTGFHDPAFWDALEANGKEVLASRLGLQVDASVRVLREPHNKLYLVLRHPAHLENWNPPPYLAV